MKGKPAHFITLTLIVSMILADISLFISSPAGSADDTEAGFRVEYESHETETALADGYFEDANSSSANGHPGSVTVTEDTGARCFTILEILPTAKKGVVGYTIGGCEPFDVDEIVKDGEVVFTKEQMKTACMDALTNKDPGTQEANLDWKLDMGSDRNYFGGFLLSMGRKIQEGDGSLPFDFEYYEWNKNDAVYNGHYKYVGYAGTNKGVYSIENKNSSNPIIRSRYYYPGRSDYDYVFVYDEESSDPADLNVYNEKRIKYKNNEKFLKDYLQIPESEIADWKLNHEVEVITRAPQDVDEDDIEKADVIIINNGDQMDYHKDALKLYNAIHKGKKNFDDVTDNDLVFSSSIDFKDFQKVFKIYERVVMRKDAALIASKNCYYGKMADGSGFNGSKFDTNMRKLMCMLFFVVKKDDWNPGSGREFFSDFLKQYTSEPEYFDSNGLPLYRAHTLQRCSDPNDPSYYYMHRDVGFHVGHPMVLSKDDAIVGGHYVNGVLTPYHYYDEGHSEAELRPVLLVRYDTEMYENAGIHEKEKGSDGIGYYKDRIVRKENGQEVRDWSGNPVYDDVYIFDTAYSSMSNTTDFVFIDKQGTLQIDNKYSSDMGDYWFKIDPEGGVNGEFACRRMKWDAQSYQVWPWDEEISVWLFKKPNNPNYYQANQHIWYEYYTDEYSVDKYRGRKAIDGSYNSNNEEYGNQSIEQESDMFKGTLIQKALYYRTVKREEKESSVTKSKAYYLSMNIVNGDGVNRKAETDPTTKNKTLYYNQYEESKIESEESGVDDAYIPIKIQIKSSCKLKSVTVSDGGSKEIVYNFGNADPDQNTITGTSSAGNTLKLEREIDEISHNPKQEMCSDGLTPFYTYDGDINGVLYDWYKNSRNKTITVTFTALLPDEVTTDDAEDTITIVRRDFFMLN